METQLSVGESTLIVSRPRSALVLSAGGMFGAYQAGVWERLATVFDPDIVVGASVGALNGWRIACGCEPGDLTERWSRLGNLAAVTWRIPTRLADGIIDNTALEAWIRSECGTGIPQRDYGVVLTHWRTMKPVLFRGSSVGWQHIATSCAVPLFLRHYKIDGDSYTDGGLLDPLPLQAAIDMGATRIVTVNLLKHRPWFIRSAVHAIRSCTGYRLPDCKEIQVVDISPPGRLGSARDSMYWDDGKTRRWIEQGREDADRQLRQVVECLDQAKGPGEKSGQCPPTASIA